MAGRPGLRVVERVARAARGQAQLAAPVARSVCGGRVLPLVTSRGAGAGSAGAAQWTPWSATGVRAICSSAGTLSPQVEAVLEQLARTQDDSAPAAADAAPIAPADDGSTVEMTGLDDFATFEGERTADIRSVPDGARQEVEYLTKLLLNYKLDTGEGATGWPAGEHADEIKTLLGWLSPQGTVLPERAADAALMLKRLPQADLLLSEIFSVAQLAESVTRAAALAREAGEEGLTEAECDAQTEEVLSKCGGVVGLMELDASMIPTDRSNVLRVKSMVAQLPARQQQRYVLPLGGVDVGRFVADVLPYAPGCRAVAELQSQWSNTPLEHRELWTAWRNLPSSLKGMMPATAAVAAECGRLTMGRELQVILDGHTLEADWSIDGWTLRGTVVHDDVRTILEQGLFVKSLDRDADGLLTTEADRAAVERLRPLLPPRLRDVFETPDELAQTLLDAYRIQETERTPHPEADLQYTQWREVKGAETPVPLDRAHAFFVHGEPLVPPADHKREMAYRFPSPLHKPTVSDITEAPRQGQLFSVRSGTESALTQHERGLLAKSSAVYTSRIVFNEVLIWLERMQDRLDAVVTPLPPKEGETLEELETRRNVFNEQVATGKRAPLPVWATREEMSSRTGGQLSMFEHRTLTQLLTTLWEHPHGGLVQQDITMFTRGAGKERKEEKKSTVDQFGRARALGRRKESQAKASVVPGEGVITVNGLSLSEYFRRTIDRYEVIRPLMLTGLVTQVDIDCTTRGGGNTGQAGACRHAISRAIADLYPEKRPALKKALFLRRDPRMVERKKPGQKKARKKFQWVKR